MIRNSSYYRDLFSVFDSACPSGRYGKGCKYPCGDCLNDITCHHINGTCEDGCGDGFYGEFCTTRKYCDIFSLFNSKYCDIFSL